MTEAITDATTDTDPQDWEGWVILELMGHRRLAGWLAEVQIGGASFLRLDVPGGDPGDDDLRMIATQFYSPSAVYCITPSTEPMAREVAKLARPAPVQRWELPAPPRRHDDPDDYRPGDLPDIDHDDDEAIF